MKRDTGDRFQVCLIHKKTRYNRFEDCFIVVSLAFIKEGDNGTSTIAPIATAEAMTDIVANQTSPVAETAVSTPECLLPELPERTFKLVLDFSTSYYILWRQNVQWWSSKDATGWMQRSRNMSRYQPRVWK